MQATAGRTPAVSHAAIHDLIAGLRASAPPHEVQNDLRQLSRLQGDSTLSGEERAAVLRSVLGLMDVPEPATLMCAARVVLQV